MARIIIGLWFLLGTGNLLQAQSATQWLGLGSFSRGPIVSYSRDLNPQQRLLLGLRLGILSSENRPQSVFPGLEAQYQYALWQAPGGYYRPALWIGPWVGINRVRADRIYPRIGYWAPHMGLQAGYRAPFMKSERFQIEGTLGLGYANILLNAPDWFEEEEMRYRNLLERWQAPHRGLYPRLGLNLYYRL